MADSRQHQQCSGALTPLLALSLGRTSQLLQSQMHPLARRLARGGESLLGLLARGQGLRLSSLLRALLLFLLSMLALALSFTRFAFGQAIAAKIEEVIAGTARATRGPFRAEELAGLPEPVRRYFAYALQEGQPAITYCSLKQSGVFRLRASPGMRANEGWKPVKATQYFSIPTPGYVWVATIQLAPLFWIRGWDSYVRGRGHMFWKLLSAVPLVNFGGPEIDRAALSRYLSEAVFFPTALLPSARLRWQAGPTDDCAHATLTHGGVSVSATFHFNAAGQVTRLQASDRPRRLDDGTTSIDSWTGHYRDYQRTNGVCTPRTMEAAWNLVGGDFPYAVLDVRETRLWGDVEAKHYLL